MGLSHIDFRHLGYCRQLEVVLTARVVLGGPLGHGLVCVVVAGPVLGGLRVLLFPERRLVLQSGLGNELSFVFRVPFRGSFGVELRVPLRETESLCIGE